MRHGPARSKFTSGGVETLLTGTLTGTEKVFFARNNKTTPDVVCVAPGTGASRSRQRRFRPLPMRCWRAEQRLLHGFFFIFTYGDGTLQASGQNDVTINTLDKTKAQSKPGGLTRHSVQRAIGGAGTGLR
jgi:hypothetical protein